MAGNSGQSVYMTIVLTMVTMVAFASNSILCRLALAQGAIDPTSFTSVRILSGVALLSEVVSVRLVVAMLAVPGGVGLAVTGRGVGRVRGWLRATAPKSEP